MRLLYGKKHFPECHNGVVATIGNFDGVHLGHQNLIKELRKKADALNLPLVLVLFEPQPKEYFQKDNAPARLYTLREKLQYIDACGVDFVYCIQFNKIIAQTSAQDFITKYLFNKLKVKYLLVGEDFRFGKNREGNVELLHRLSAQHGSCKVHTYQEFCINEERISSTRIRDALRQGNLTLAKQLLGHPYGMCGRIIKGDGRGRQWGVPTANIGIHRASLALTGVFIVQVKWNNRTVNGVANVGSRPTVDGTKNVLEVHLLDFNESIYGELVRVFFLHKLRDEVKFTSVDALITQIHKDIAAATAYLDLNTAKI
jgi:riboflavin kinase/FMN adenylyltransferase